MIAGDGISASNRRIDEPCCKIQTKQRNQDDAVKDHTEEHKAYTTNITKNTINKDLVSVD